MTLNMVIDRNRIEAAQQQISRIIQSALPNIVSDKVIGFPSGSQNVQFNTLGHGRLYYVYRNIVKDVPEPRHWNTFGFYNEKKQNQDIVVETCIPKSNLNRRTAAFFVEDSASGVIYLAHDGGVGGGYTGVGKTNFRAFYPQKRLIQAFHNGKIYRDGYILGRVDSPALVERITTFAEEVADFKRFIRTSEGQSWANERRNTDSVNHQSIVESDFLPENNYNAEFSGKKKGYKIGVADYISYHGKVVHELQSLLTARNEQSKVYNDRLVDLWMERDGIVSDVFEVKTSVGRQSLYTAIGQIITHTCGSRFSSAQRWLSLPAENEIPADIQSAMNQNNIKVLKYKLKTIKDKLYISFSGSSLK